MAPFFFALALLAADPADTAVATQVPAPAPALGEPTTEYQLVAWCYGALGAHMGLHDLAMPEVERIERQFERIPGAGKADLESYERQREEGKKQLALFRAAMTAAEKASVRPLQQEGLTAIRKGEGVWSGSAMADPKHLAREWMSWGLPERCTTTATSLQAKASVLGQALSYNAQPVEAEAEADVEASADPIGDLAAEAQAEAVAEEQPALEEEELAAP